MTQIGRMPGDGAARHQRVDRHRRQQRLQLLRPDARHVPRRRAVQGRPQGPADVPGREGRTRWRRSAARARCGCSDQIGSLEPGKRADVVLHDTDRPEWRPLLNVDQPARVVGRRPRRAHRAASTAAWSSRTAAARRSTRPSCGPTPSSAARRSPIRVRPPRQGEVADPCLMRPAKALERPPCRTGSSPLNDVAWSVPDAAGEGAGAPAVPNRSSPLNDAGRCRLMRPAKALERPPCRTGLASERRGLAPDAAAEGAGAPAVPNRVFASE